MVMDLLWFCRVCGRRAWVGEQAWGEERGLEACVSPPPSVLQGKWATPRGCESSQNSLIAYRMMFAAGLGVRQGGFDVELAAGILKHTV
jgi:hypothetical protein